MRFADKLRDLRLAKEWSQKDLAGKAGFAQSAIARWEAGQQIPAFDSVLVLCEALQVECAYFKDCDFAEVADKRGRGRPPKAETEAVPVVKAAAKPKPKKKGGK